MSERPLVIHYMYRDDYGGGPKAVFSIVQQLGEIASQQVVTSGRGKLRELCGTDPSLKFHQLTAYPHCLLPLSVLELVALCWRLRPDVIVTHGQWGGLVAGLARCLNPKAAGIYVCHWCSLYHSTDVYRAARNYFVEWVTFKAHEHIVCLSEGNVRQFLFAGLLADRQRVTVIPNCIELTDEAGAGEGAASDHVLQRNAEETVFIFLGRLEHQKRPDWLLQAWKTACDAGLQKARLLILGDGDLRAESERLAGQLGIAGSVSFLGYCPDAGRYLGEADALVMTSLFEGHANVVLEAMAHSKPIIAMFADGVQESFTDGVEGYLVNLGDTEAFARRIVELANDPAQRRRMGENGRERAKQFSPAQQRTAYRKVLQKALERAWSSDHKH